MNARLSSALLTLLCWRALCRLAPRFGPHIYSAEQVAAGKPTLDLALFAAARLGTAPDRAVFIDDTHYGIRCGRDAGFVTIGFVGPSEHRPDHARVLRDAGADHVVHGADALLEGLGLPVAPPAA